VDEGVTVSDSRDRRLEEELTAALSDPLPPDVLNTVEELLTWRTVDAELAELLSMETHDPLSSGVRDAGTVTTLTYRAGPVSVDLEIDADARLLRGQVLPEQSVDVRLVRYGGSEERATRASAMGTFLFDRMAAGPAQLVLVTSTGSTIKTPWFIT
jgi:hypothetical protein